jgi:rRNA maturation endonuclease Nob1
MSKTAEEFQCDGCGAEYTITYDASDILEDADYCPFCGEERGTYDYDDRQEELDFNDD